MKKSFRALFLANITTQLCQEHGSTTRVRGQSLAKLMAQQSHVATQNIATFLTKFVKFDKIDIGIERSSSFTNENN